MSDGPTHLYLRHARALSYCTNGIYSFFIRRNWDYFDFIKNGKRISDVKPLNHHLINEMIKIAEAEWVAEKKLRQ